MTWYEPNIMSTPQQFENECLNEPYKSPQRKYVLAKNYRRFRMWCRETHTDPRDADYLSREEDLCGKRLSKTDLVELEGWRENPNYNSRFRDYLRIAVRD